MTVELAYAGAAALARKVVAGEVTARQLTDMFLARIEAHDDTIGSYLAVDAEGARARADEIDAMHARGEALGPLGGVPIALKDILVTKGLETTAASRILKGWVPPYDGTVVARLRDAGAVILGKLNCDEFAMGSSNENSSVKPCRNPWDTERVPGGSSGGSAAAVAAGLCAAALGTDTGGSIRQPASMCGIVGLKPTYGRVSRYGVIAFASSLDQVGPMTHNVEDAALLLSVIAGHDPHDATSIPAEVPDYSAALSGGLEGLTIGLPDEYFGDGTDPEVTAAVQNAIEVLHAQGATTKRVSLPHTKYALPTYYLIAPAEASSNLARYDGIRYGLSTRDEGASLLDVYRKSRSEGFGPEVKRRIMLGTFALRSGYYDEYYGKAQKVRALIKRDFDRVFEDVDLIASPTSPTPAFRIGEKTDDPIEMYLADIFTLSCNLAGIPGVSVPCGFTEGGLPIGLQLLAPILAEEKLLCAAAAFERSIDLGSRIPEATRG